MTPAQALDVLAQMADRAPGNGADHRTVREAYDLLAQLVNPVEDRTDEDDL